MDAQLRAMTSVSSKLPKVKTSSPVARRIQPRDDWSEISKLPPDIEKQVILERQLELTTASAWIDNYPEEGRLAQILSATDRLATIGAERSTESMLAVQMVNTHEAYVDAHRRALMNADRPELFSLHIRNAERLSGLYMRQLAAWDKHRGRGKQQVRVEHVHVAAGGQAVVGHLEVQSITKCKTQAK